MAELQMISTPSVFLLYVVTKMEVMLANLEHLCFSFSKGPNKFCWGGTKQLFQRSRENASQECDHVSKALKWEKKKKLRKNTISFFQKKNLTRVVHPEQLVLCFGRVSIVVPN